VGPVGRVRGDLERLGQASWIVEWVARLTAERDRHVAVYALLIRSLRALEGRVPPSRVALCFGVRALETLGHRPRLDACTECGRAYPLPRPALGAGGVVCEPCAREDAGTVPASSAALAAFARLRSARWDEALVTPVGRSESEIGALLETQVSRLIGQPTRAPKSLRAVRPLQPTPSGPACRAA